MACSTSSEKRYRGGKRCVAGGPNLVSCANNQQTEGISMHLFPNEETDPQRRRKWVNFVRKHRPSFHASATSCLCSAHFEDSCYDVNLTLAKALNMKRRLKEDVVPTIDVAGIVPPAEEQLTDRRRRQIIRKRLSPVKLASSPAKVDENIPTTSQNVDDTIYDLSYDSDTEFDLTASSHSSCTSCHGLKKRMKALQKKLCWFKKTKANLQKKVQRLEAENVVRPPRVNTADLNKAYSDEDSKEENFDDATSMDYSSLEESSQSAVEMDEDVTRNTVSVDEGTSSYNEPMFLVSYSPLVELFGKFCFNCKAENPKVQVKHIGSMATVVQACSKCLMEDFTWRSQPMVMGRYAAGNIMTSFGILMSGINQSSSVDVQAHEPCLNMRTNIYLHKSTFLFPAILKHWEVNQSGLIEDVKNSEEESQTWSGDGRFDSMGHSAKYGVYTIWSNTTSKLVHFELLQANEVGSSNAMELEGAKRAFKLLKESGLKMDIFISDRHKGIAKWIRTKQKGTKHYNDIWHVNKSINKQLRKAGKEKGCEVINDWLKGVRKHLYWSAQTTLPGFEDLIVAKWKSTVRHMAGKHEDHPDPLFTSCAHGELEERKWIPIGTVAYDRICSILLKKSILKDIAKLSPDGQTSCLEGFHSTLNHWHPKMTHFSWLGTFCRHIIAILHFNENVQRESKKTKDGLPIFNVTFPKFKLGEEVVREVTVQPTYEYVNAVRNILFTTSEKDLSETVEKYKNKAPEPLCRQFTDRRSREDAIKRHNERKALDCQALFPTLEEQTQQQSDLVAQQEASRTAQQTQLIRRCGKCKKPMKGHPRSRCPDSVS